VQVTVVLGPRHHYLRELHAAVRARARACVLGLFVLSVAIAAPLMVVSSGRHSARVPGSPSVPAASAAQLERPGAAGVAAAFRYPLGCLSVTIISSHPAYATAQLNRASPCWRYGVYVTAIFRRVGRAWRLMLEADSHTCPAVSLPAAVRAQLAVCARSGAGTPPGPLSVPERVGALDRHPVPLLGPGGER
jgi:hypothetical protein